MNPAGTPPTDEATRYLCAAAHLDPTFADAVVKEFLSEPKRAIPASPGVRAEPVLREALTAQRSRRQLDAALVGLFILLTFLAFPLVLAWLLSALSWKFLEFFVVRVSVVDKGGRTGYLLGPRQRWWATLLLWSCFAVFWTWVPALGFAGTAVSLGDEGMTKLSILLVIGGFVLAPVVFGVLVAMHYLPWRTALTLFRFGSDYSAAGQREAALRACARDEHRLQRFTAEEAHRSQVNGHELTVYRGRDSFVGTGLRARSWSSAFQLRAKKGSDWANDPVPAFAPGDLYAYISQRIEELRTAQHLTPGSRFVELTNTQWVAIAAAQLPYEPSAHQLLVQMNNGHDPRLDPAQWASLANSSPEWMRYYRCYRVSGWSQQMVVTGFLHIGCEERTLYIEWHGFVVPPVSAGLRTIDTPPKNLEWLVLRRGLTDLALLPTTIPGRISDIVRGIRESNRPSDTTWATPAQAAEVFGVATGIREIAAATQMNNVFQELDGDRYLKIMERRVLDAVHRFLDDRGIHAKGFDEMVTQINNSTVFNGSNVIAGSVGGSSNTGTVGSGTEPASSGAA